MRYIRQELFNAIGKNGQKKLGKSAIAIVGLGALGSVAAELLARAGIGNMVLIDRDIVELSNLQRQNLFNEHDLGKPKAQAAKEHLEKINSETNIEFHSDDLNFDNISSLLASKMMILDCTDNLETRFLINDFAIKNNVPFIYSSAVGSKGYVFDIVPGKTACLRCFLKQAALETCETTGILNTITGIIPSIQASEAMKILLGKEHEKSLLYFDVWKNELFKIKVRRKKDCTACGKRDFEYLEGKKASRIVKMCGEGIYQIHAMHFGKKQFDELKKRLKKAGNTMDFGYCLNFGNKIKVFGNGRALVKAQNEKEAKSLYSRLVGN